LVTALSTFILTFIFLLFKENLSATNQKKS
jgi:hypothetical protein